MKKYNYQYIKGSLPKNAYLFYTHDDPPFPSSPLFHSGDISRSPHHVKGLIFG